MYGKFPALLVLIASISSVSSVASAETSAEIIEKLRELRGWCNGYGGPYGTSEAACEEESRLTRSLSEEYNFCFEGVGAMTNYVWQECGLAQEKYYSFAGRGADYEFDGITATLTVPLVELQHGEVLHTGKKNDDYDKVVAFSCREGSKQNMGFYFLEGEVPASGGAMFMFGMFDEELPRYVASYSGRSTEDREMILEFGMGNKLPELIMSFYDNASSSFRFHDPDKSGHVLNISLQPGLHGDSKDKFAQFYQICRVLS